MKKIFTVFWCCFVFFCLEESTKKLSTATKISKIESPKPTPEITFIHIIPASETPSKVDAESESPFVLTSQWKIDLCIKQDLFPCNNKKVCITKTEICNGKDDCGDNSDEQFCSGKTNDLGSLWGSVPVKYTIIKEQRQSTTAKPEIQEVKVRTGFLRERCLKNDYACDNGYTCYDPSLKCDGNDDCGDGTDERGCPNTDKEKQNAALDKSTNTEQLRNENIQKELQKQECTASSSSAESKELRKQSCMLPERKNENVYIRNCLTAHVRDYTLLKSGSHIDADTIVVSKCDPGYARDNGADLEFRSKCEKKVWTPSIPECKRVCDTFSFEDLNLECFRKGKRVDCRGPFFIDTLITYMCKSSLQHGDPNAQRPKKEMACLDSGKWSTKVPNCQQDSTENTLAVSSILKVTTAKASTSKYSSSVTKKPAVTKAPTTTKITISQLAINKVKTACQDIVIEESQLQKPTRFEVEDDFAHMASLGYYFSEDLYYWFCDGTLISERFVLSSAHCVETEGGRADWIALGSPNAKIRPIQKIINVYTHPGYTAPYVYNDIALFKLKENAKFTPNLRPICLPTSDNVHGSDRLLSASYASGDPKLTRVLQSEMQLDNVRCLNEYNSDNRFSKGFETESLVCATPLTWVNTTKMGGPLQMAIKNKNKLWTQIGISSVLPDSSRSGISNGPVVYVRVAYYVDWIAKIVWV